MASTIFGFGLNFPKQKPKGENATSKQENQEELQKIHHQYGTSEKSNYKIQLLFEEYSENYFQTRTTLDKNVLNTNESFFSVISKIDNFLKIEPILISDKDNLVKKEFKIKFKHKRNANIYCKHFNSAFDNGKSLEDCKKIALDEINRIFDKKYIH